MAFAGYSHFTAMQVRNHAVRGLDLHLDRLRAASTALFGTHLPDDLIRAHLRTALVAGPKDSSVTYFIAASPGEFEPDGPKTRLDSYIRVSDAATPPAGPLTLDVVTHERDLPEVKHVGEVGKTLYLRRAQSRGFDDALFIDHENRIAEATIWNIAFWDGDAVLWPQASMLDGVTQQIVARQLTRAGVRQRTRPIHIDEVGKGISAAIMNSWTPAIPISRIGDHALRTAPEFIETLHKAYEGEPGLAA